MDSRGIALKGDDLKKLFLFFTLGLALAYAQSAPSFAVTTGPLGNRTCNDQVNVGSINTTLDNPSITYVCQQTGTNTYGWVSSFQASVTGGTLTITANKTPSIAASIAFAGTDSTTMTFPTVSGTVATIAGTQTLTNKTLTSPVMTAPTLGVASATSLAAGACTISTNSICAAGHLLFEGVTSTGATGTGKMVFDTTPTLVTPVLGAATGTTISLSGAYTSTLASGSAPLVITSTTPVAHLTSQVLAYNAAGTQQLESHAVFGTCTLGSTCVITFTGSAAWTSNSSYYCAATDRTAAAAIKVVNDTSSQATFTGTGTDVLGYVCIGN